MLPSPKIATSRPCCTTSALPISSNAWFCFRFCSRSGATRITHRDRPGVVIRHCPKHVDKFVFILRLHVHDVWHVPEIADIEQTMMRRTIVAAQTSAIHAKRDIQILQRDVVNDHVVGALHERRVNCQKRFQALRRQAAGEKRGMFFGNADIEITSGMLCLEKSEPCPARHRASDRDDLLICVGEFCEGLADNLRISGCRRRRGFAALDFVFSETVKLIRLRNCRIVAFAFFGQDVEQTGSS